MQKELVLYEIKLLELKLQALKAKVLAEPPSTPPHATADLYGLLRGSEEIATEDIEAVKIRLKELVG